MLVDSLKILVSTHVQQCGLNSFLKPFKWIKRTLSAGMISLYSLVRVCGKLRSKNYMHAVSDNFKEKLQKSH